MCRRRFLSRRRSATLLLAFGHFRHGLSGSRALRPLPSSESNINCIGNGRAARGRGLARACSRSQTPRRAASEARQHLDSDAGKIPRSPPCRAGRGHPNHSTLQLARINYAESKQHLDNDDSRDPAAGSAASAARCYARPTRPWSARSPAGPSRPGTAGARREGSGVASATAIRLATHGSTSTSQQAPRAPSPRAAMPEC